MTAGTAPTGPVIRSATAPLLGERRSDALALLTPAERSRFATESQPERFLAGRMLLRELVADLAGRDLASITVTAACPDCGAEHGKPVIDGVFVSLSHAGEVVVAAASTTAPVGVDVEPRDGGAFRGATERVAAIRLVAGGDDLQHWTRVEAVLKADGRGLRVDPTEVGIRADRATLDGVGYALTDASDDEHVISIASRLAGVGSQ
ncbi:MAG TPA: 4-phosphopantetheinyl transferase [Pseudolysinimonas sp.]|jgi:4'-phosphopantetheinyl transferase